MDKSFFEENDTIIVSFHNKSLWINSIKTKREIQKFKRKGFHISEETTFTIGVNGFTSNLVFVKNK